MQHFFFPTKGRQNQEGQGAVKVMQCPESPPEILELTQKAEPQWAARAARVWGWGWVVWGSQGRMKSAGQMAPVILCSQSAL